MKDQLEKTSKQTNEQTTSTATTAPTKTETSTKKKKDNSSNKKSDTLPSQPIFPKDFSQVVYLFLFIKLYPSTL